MKTLQCLLLVAIHVAIAQGDEHIQLKYLEREFYSWRKAERGIGDYRQDDRLEQFDLELIDIRTEYAGYLLETLLNISKVNLSEKDQMDYAIMQDMLQAYTNGRNWSRWTYLTPMSWLEGLQRNPDLFVESTNFLNIGDFENYISKLHDFPRLFREYKISFNEAIRLGRASNIRSIDRIPGQIEHILNVSVTQSIYYKPFITYLNDTYLSLPDPEAVIESVQKRGLKAVEIVFEAYKDLKDYLENIYMKNTRPSAGLGTLAGGADFYQECLNWYLSLKMTPGEIHRLGLQEIDKIKDKMYEIIEKQGYHNISIRDYFAELKKREDMFFDTEDDIIAEYENIIHRRIEPHLNKFFRDQPGLPVVVHPMPSDGSRGWYYSGSADGMRPGIFYANTKRRVPKYVMMSLAMHESNPGHHLQMSYSLTSDLSDFRKNSENNEKFRVPFAIPSYTAFVEGWALYAESLGVETGIYEKDYELLGYYESELFRAARLAVDTGLHYFNWTRDQAQEFFIQHTAESKEGIVVEVDRYITWPGQATTYKIGELWIRALRERAEKELGIERRKSWVSHRLYGPCRDRAEKELGELFDVREFHMAVLENGAIPLPILEDQVLKWIKDYRKRKLEEEEMDGECECVMVPRAKPKVRCRRSSPLTLEPNAAHRLQAVYIISGPEAILFCQKLAVTNGNECPASLKPSAFTSKAKCLHLKLDCHSINKEIFWPSEDKKKVKMMSGYTSEDQWIAIQKKTFANWANEQLKIGNRSVDDLAVDFSDGVRLVALVEALQFRKLGKVFQRPTSRIQMLQNVSLALQAVAEDNVRLVNIGNDDIVDANLKLTLGLLWHLILRYQISGARAAPPRKLMLSWFRSMLPDDLDITNLTTSWSDGRALHALLEQCRPGLSPDWRNLQPGDAVSNCQKAMRLAKEKLGIPRVISAEDFASPELDELSAMTYLSYFIKKDSPGYNEMLEWVRKQLKTLKVTNFTTDWNDGQLLCSLVHSYGGGIPGWPLLDKSGNVAACQIGLDSAHALGVQKTISASELADPKVDHLTVMTYVALFKKVTPRLPKAQKCRVETRLEETTVGQEVSDLERGEGRGQGGQGGKKTTLGD
ncbi:hypothetical protein RRG08_039893 [Elysia crispata]|uniref:Calponin-homology (CH) domain-containing protein n=1 Tax=Elysia crispata TaxID=231223 RepID=A0AAE0ZVR2_9GAST|nr:hypothetical protein RRG08_039893 [Elysia crispata]KAK3776306.1 hypothetical protein RRG08_039893 [Elysia crispata]